MRIFLFTISSLFFSTFIFSQQTFIKGRVVDSGTKEAIPGVSVKFDSTGVVTDFNGEFVISGQPGKKTDLEFNFIAYDKITLKTQFPSSDTLKIDVGMKGMNELLDEVVVSAGKFDQKLSDVTVSMEVIKPALVENKNTTSLEFFMNQVPGVNTYDGQVSIRNGSGFSYGAGSRVLILVDEMPMISADAGDIKWNYLPIENMEQIEVLKGAASALFGSSALNGVINLRTAYPKDKPMTNVTLYNGTYSKPRNEKWAYWPDKQNPSYRGMNFTHSEKIGQWDLVLGGHLFDDEGFRQGETEVRERFNANVRYRFKKVPGLSAGVNVNMMDYKGALFFLWDSATKALTPQPGTLQAFHNNRINYDPFIVYFTEKAGKHSLRTRYFRTENNNDKNQSSTAELYYAEYQFQKKFKKKFTLTTGLVYMEQQVYSDSIFGRHTGQNMAGYLQFDKKIKKLTLSLGLRAEHFRVDTAVTKGSIGNKINNLPVQPVVRFGSNYQLFEYTFLRASFGQGYRFPSGAEKFISTSISALKIVPNPSLQPEKGYSAEIGVKQGFKISRFRGFLDVAGFYSEYRNMIEFVFGYYAPPGVNVSNPVIKSGYAGFKSINMERGRVTGIDVSVTGKGKIGKVEVAMMGGYTYSKAINPVYDAASDTISPGTLEGSNLLKYSNRVLWKNDLQLDYKGFSVGWSNRYNSRMQNIDKRFEQPLLYDLFPTIPIYILPGLKEFRAKEPKGFWFNDFRISYNFTKQFKFAVILNNAFNTEYAARPGYIAAPRTLVFQVNVKV
ncbi:MAG: TonB-dependent receptor [Bacteroidia bacterium]|nr:TonB-dependent receptor [Bacteroidia bacterium]